MSVAPSRGLQKFSGYVAAPGCGPRRRAADRGWCPASTEARPEARLRSATPARPYKRTSISPRGLVGEMSFCSPVIPVISHACSQPPRVTQRNREFACNSDFRCVKVSAQRSDRLPLQQQQPILPLLSEPLSPCSCRGQEPRKHDVFTVNEHCSVAAEQLAENVLPLPAFFDRRRLGPRRSPAHFRTRLRALLGHDVSPVGRLESLPRAPLSSMPYGYNVESVAENGCVSIEFYAYSAPRAGGHQPIETKRSRRHPGFRRAAVTRPVVKPPVVSFVASADVWTRSVGRLIRPTRVRQQSGRSFSCVHFRLLKTRTDEREERSDRGDARRRASESGDCDASIRPAAGDRGMSNDDQDVNKGLL